MEASFLILLGTFYFAFFALGFAFQGNGLHLDVLNNLKIEFEFLKI